MRGPDESGQGDGASAHHRRWHQAPKPRDTLAPCIASHGWSAKRITLKCCAFRATLPRTGFARFPMSLSFFARPCADLQTGLFAGGAIAKPRRAAEP